MVSRAITVTERVVNHATQVRILKELFRQLVSITKYMWPGVTMIKSILIGVLTKGTPGYLKISLLPHSQVDGI